MPRTKQIHDEKKTLQAVLTLSGLGEKESKLYMILLDEGVTPASVLITKSGLKKGNTYALLHQMEEKKLVRSFEKDKKQYFQPEPPQNVLEMLQKRSEETKLATQYFEHILPDLASQYKKSIGKPIIQYVEGESGVREIFKLSYENFGKVTYGCNDPTLIPDTLWNTFILKDLMPLRIKNGVRALTLRPIKGKKTPEVRENSKLLKTLYEVDAEKYPMPCEIDASDDKVAFMTYKDSKLTGAIIENKDFSTAIQSIFRLCMDLIAATSKQKQAF